MRVGIIAGFARSELGCATVEFAERFGVEVAGIAIVRAMQLRRVRRMLNQQGVPGLLVAVRRSLRTTGVSERGALAEFRSRHEMSVTNLAQWAKLRRVPTVSVSSPNSPEAVLLMERASPDIVFYCGGGILRREMLEACGRRIVNAHQGPLPEIRGMNALEWSLWYGLTPTVTLHYIDDGIDTGPTISRHSVSVVGAASIAEMRERGLVTAIQAFAGLLADGRIPESRPQIGTPRAKLFYRMSTMLKETIEANLARAHR